MPDADTNKNPTIALLGVPIEIGASQAGTLMGPAALRTAGIARVLEQLGLTVEDHGDLATPGKASTQASPNDPSPANAKYYDEIKVWVRGLSERAFQIAGSGAIPIFMGGDHSLSMGSVNGVARYWQQHFLLFLLHSIWHSKAPRIRLSFMPGRTPLWLWAPCSRVFSLAD